MQYQKGIQDKNKKLISQIVSKKKKEYDAHGNIQLSGSGSLGDFLAEKLNQNLNCQELELTP